MTQTVPEENQLYRHAGDLPAALWDDVDARDPQEAARACGALWQDGVFELTLLARSYRIDPALRRIERLDEPRAQVSFQSGMILLCALGNALEVPPSGRMVTPHELPGGALFFSGPHALATPELERRFGHRLADLKAAADSLGAKPSEGADMAFSLPGLPQIPLYLLFWAADDEFPARAVLGIDPHAKHHLALDGIWALTNRFVDRLLSADPQK